MKSKRRQVCKLSEYQQMCMAAILQKLENENHKKTTPSQGTFCSVSRRESRYKLRRSLINNKNTSDKSRIIRHGRPAANTDLSREMHSTRPTGKLVRRPRLQTSFPMRHRDWRIGKSRDVYSRVLWISMSLTDSLHLVVYGWRAYGWTIPRKRNEVCCHRDVDKMAGGMSDSSES